MKKILISLFLTSLLLTACGGSDSTTDGTTEDSEEAFYFTYKTSEFEMEVPDDWEIEDAFTPEYPDNLEVAFKNAIQDSVFTSNVTVLKENNTRGDTSYDFGQRKLADHEGTLVNFALISQETVTLTVGGAESKTMLSIFEGKNDNSGPKLRFMQITLTKGTEAWTVTGTARSGEDELILETIDTMLRSFTLK
ncbi:MAG: hypothetical protein WC777_05225 [Candidatus Gracilibacteria bacterium]|jgi:hypothetical protein